VMDGWDFLRAIRVVRKWDGIGVIIVSATVEQDQPKPVLPAKAFLAKPITARQIINLHRYCDRHRDSWTPKIDVS
jgi:CheY-like chemotaxis protein